MRLVRLGAGNAGAHHGGEAGVLADHVVEELAEVPRRAGSPTPEILVGDARDVGRGDVEGGAVSGNEISGHPAS